MSGPGQPIAVAGRGWQMLLAFVFLGCVFLLALIRIEDPDTWTHLSFGRWIWEHRALPAGEPFIDTGSPFSYNNWLFGLLYYLAYLAGGHAGVVILKATLITLLLALLLRIAMMPRGNLFVSVLVLGAVAMGLRFRFVERPDTLMMLFLSYAIFSLGAFAAGDRKYLFLMPLVSLLWANVHTSILMMLLPFGAVLAGGVFQLGMERAGLDRRLLPFVGFTPAPSFGQLRQVAIVAAISVATSLISPYFLDQYLHSVGALQSDWWRQSISELRKPTWEEFKALYVFTAAVVLSFIANRRRVSLPDVLLAAPLLVMPFLAIRFFWFTAITGALLARNIAGILASRERAFRLSSGKPAIALSALLIVCATAVQLFPPRGQRPLNDLQFGLGVNYTGLTPEYCLRYLDRRRVTGRVLNTFHLGGYITWRDYPKRVPFMDGRGFLDDNLLEQATMAPTKPGMLDAIRSRHPFESAVLVQPVTAPKFLREIGDADLVLSHPDWSLVYWDDICLVYLRNGGPYDSAIAEDAYRFLIPSRGVQGSRLSDPETREGVAAELERAIRETDASMAWALKGVLLNELGQHPEAIEAFTRVENHPAPLPGSLYDAYLGKAYAYHQLGKPQDSIRYYKMALELHENGSLHQRLALAYASAGDTERAIRHYEKAIELNSALMSVYPQLLALYQGMARKDDVERVRRKFQGTQQFSAGETHFKAGTKAYVERDYALAISEFQKSIEANPDHPAAYSNLGYLYFDSGDLEKALEYHRRALDIDASADLSHYGIALAYRDLGNKAKAREHWTEYLRLKPEGYYSRKAKQELESLR